MTANPVPEIPEEIKNLMQHYIEMQRVANANVNYAMVAFWQQEIRKLQNIFAPRIIIDDNPNKTD